MANSATSTLASDLPAASGLAGTTTSLPEPGEYPYLDVQTQVPILIGISATFMVLSTIVVALRLYTRYVLIKVAGDDDITIGIAQVLNFGLIATAILQSAYGLGRHTWMIDAADKRKQLELMLASEILYYAAQTVTKVSLLLQYRRIFRGLKWTRLTCLVLYIFVVAWCVLSIVTNALACMPMAVLNPLLDSTCLPSLLTWSVTSAVSIVCNFAVTATPIPATWSLHLPRKMRFILTVLFGLGFATGAVAIARILTLRKASLTSDTTWNSAPVTYFSVIEVNVGIICACVITLRPLLTEIFPSLAKSSYDGHPDAGYYARANGGGTMVGTGTKKSSRETMTHADHGIYGLADLEVNQVLNGSQEGLTSSSAPPYFEPAHFNNNPKQQQQHTGQQQHGGHYHHPSLPATFSRMSTSITSGGKFPARKIGMPAAAVHKIRTRSGDIMITRETTIREETMALPMAGGDGGNGMEKDCDHGSWLTESSTNLKETNHPHTSPSG